MIREYKECGNRWIGEIPVDWCVSKLKHIAKFRNGKAHEKDADLKGSFVIVNSRFVSTEGSRRKYCNVLIEPLYVNEICIVMSDVPNGRAYAKTFLVDRNDFYTLNQRIGAFSVTNNSVNYINYVLNRNAALLSYDDGVNQTNLRKQDLLNLEIQLPQLSEQQTIANFLDDKTEKIDELIKVQENAINRLEEYRQSVITEAVTKGLNPNVDLKNSGIDWIGKIPENWKITKIRRLLSIPITDGPHETPSFYDSGVPFISAEAIKKDEIDFNKIRGYISEFDYLKYSEKYIPKLHDIYMVKSGATTGNVAQLKVEKKFTIWSPLAVFRTNELVYHRYMFYSLKADSFKKQVENKWSYGTQQNIGMRVLESLLVPFGDFDDQIEIANYLDKRTEEVNELIQMKKDKIEMLNDYKKSLIYEAVTGKIEVM